MKLNLINIKTSALKRLLKVEYVTIKNVKPEIRDREFQHFKLIKSYLNRKNIVEEFNISQILWDIALAILYNESISTQKQKDYIYLKGLYGDDRIINTKKIIFANDFIKQREVCHSVISVISVIYEAWVKYEE